VSIDPPRSGGGRLRPGLERPPVADEGVELEVGDVLVGVR
jgi:hypothetical protein